MKKIELLDLKIRRGGESKDLKDALKKGKEIIVEIKVHPLIEELFKSDDIETSGRYFDENGEPLKFYSWDSYSEDFKEELNRVCNTTNTYMSAYGFEFARYGQFNVSILRTVGISKGITVRATGLISAELLDQWAIHLKKFVEELYKLIQPLTIRTKLVIEEE